MTDRDPAHRRAVRAGYDALGATYDERRGGDRPWLDGFAARLDDGDRVLDAGCGPGGPASDLAARGFRVVGCDFSRAQLALASGRVGTGRLVRGDLTALPFRRNGFDALLAAYSVIHVPRERHGEVFAAFRRVLRPGGVALVTAGADDWEGRTEGWLGGDAEMRWSVHGPERSADLLREAGFEVLEVSTVGDGLDDGNDDAVHSVLTARADPD
ncbi:MAG: class I SAM-dependent methyltransferase [Halobacteriaceae archaeon]